MNIFKALAISFFITSLIAVNAFAAGMPDLFADLVESKSPTVVNISTSSKPKKVERKFRNGFQSGNPFENHPFFKEFFGEFPGQFPPLRQRQGRSVAPKSLGSGVVISADGYIITNSHVVEGADDIVVRINDSEDDKEYPAKIIGLDPKNDLALLKVSLEKMSYAKLANSDNARVGDWVIAIGNPFGLGGSVSAGIISARGRNINQGPYDDFLQTDAAINPGNSGGPLFNMDGEVVGINTAILSRTGGSQGIGFAIPSSTVKTIVDQLKEHGRPIRGWLGVRIQHVTPELAEAFELSDKHGALVAGIIEGSPADKAQVEEGDIILKYDGKSIKKMSDLPKMVAETNVGARVPVVVVRDGKLVQLSVRIDELDEDEMLETAGANESGVESTIVAGMTLAIVDDEVRDVLGLSDDIEGLVVENVAYDSRAARSGIRSGDVILKADRRDVTRVDTFRNIVKGGKGKSLLLLVSRDGDNLFIALAKSAEK